MHTESPSARRSRFRADIRSSPADTASSATSLSASSPARATISFSPRRLSAAPFFPAVEKGLRDSVKKGVLAGYPMVGLKATLYDGSYHPVDSSEMAFKTAANIAYKNGIPQANPVILEPIGTLKAYMPDENLGDIMGDVTKRRGRVLGMGPSDEPKIQELIAEVPMGEMGDFSTVLRSVTAGRGWFSLEFTRYEDAPPVVAQKVIDEAKAAEAESDK